MIHSWLRRNLARNSKSISIICFVFFVGLFGFLFTDKSVCGVKLLDCKYYTSSQRIDVRYSSVNKPSYNYLNLPKYITVITPEKRISTLTLETKLGDLVQVLDIQITAEDEILPSRDFILVNGLVSKINRIDSKLETIIEYIDFDTTEEEDSTVEFPQEVVVQEGKRGEIKSIYKHTYKNGKLYEKVLVSEEAISQPQNKIVKIGTKKVPKTETIDGEKITYYHKYEVYATSYDSSCAGCNNITATGAILKYGIIAADPKVIPWHTKLYVPGYGFGQMEDTGGSLRRATKNGYYMIDLGFEDVSKGWWSARWTTVYLLY